MKEVIASLGAEAGATRSAIKKWRQRGAVPPKYRFPILDVAQQKGIQVSRADFDFTPTLDGKPTRKKPAPKSRKRARAA